MEKVQSEGFSVFAMSKGMEEQSDQRSGRGEGMGRLVWEAERALWMGSGFLMLAGVIFLCLTGLDGRQLDGQNVWVKPSKFAFSGAIFLTTLGYLLFRLTLSQKTRVWLRWNLLGVMYTEVALIAFQAGRGVRSHFNSKSPFDVLIYALMGVAILYATILMFFLAHRAYKEGNLHLALVERQAIRWGLVIFLMGSMIGGVMSGLSSRYIGVHTGGAILPYVGWSRQAGDLRIAHFLGLHALQVLPLLGWFLMLCQERYKLQYPMRWLKAGGILYSLLFLLILGQSLLGMPLLRE